MLKYPEPTPYPINTTAPRHRALYATPSYCTDRYRTLAAGALLPCDDTEDIDFTTELQAARRQPKPRRRRSTKVGARSITIHEDIAADGVVTESVETCSLQPFGNARSGDIPVQQRPPAALARRALLSSYRSQEAALSLSQHGQTPVKASLARRQQHTGAVLEGSGGVAQTDQQRSARLRKEPRRRTIFVPSEDTTILTIHPGSRPEAQARNTSDETSCPKGFASSSVRAFTIFPADMARRAPRQSLATAPKRAPLQPVLKPLQERFDVSDKPGRGAGKENVPPGVRVTRPYVDGTKDSAESAGRPSTLFVHNTGPGATKPAPSCLSKHVSTKERDGLVHKDGRTQPMYIRIQRGSGTLALKLSTLGDGTKRTKENLAGVVTGHEKRSTFATPVPNGPCKLVTPIVSRPTRHGGNQYPLLSEDISRPEMFEEAWLSHKEAAISQLINGLFQSADAREPYRLSNTEKVRRDLLQLYQEPSMSLLYHRLQASFLCGALTIPSHRVHNCSSLSTDVGLRRKLVHLWTRTYHLPSLRAAAEVVIGREAHIPSDTSAAMLRDDDRPTKKTRRGLEVFLDSCLIRNEDTERSRRLAMSSSAIDQNRSASDREFGSPNWSLRRTMLRSLMMILLLDKAKGLGIISNNLFCASSSLKSSVSVLKELFSLLLPSAGDVSRPLMHLDYKVHHVQFPLNEYEYEIKNLATDLRDGVRLTRLVELLLYPSVALARQNEGFTLTMPTGEILTSEGRGSWVLSQHLKFPCAGRTQRLYNVQIALSALYGVQGVKKMVEDVTSEDIVDGYREKTMAMLWGLVGKWGLESLIDVAELRKEVRRLRKQSRECSEVEGQSSDEDVEIDTEQGLLEKHTHLLKSWANAIGRRHSVMVYNLTTAFSDGMVFEKIVDEYAQWYPQHWASSPPRSLDRKLKALGCSDYFGT